MGSLCTQTYCDHVKQDKSITLGQSDQRTRTTNVREIVPRFGGDSRFQVTVVATTRKGTHAALKAAATLARNMGAPIALAMIEVIRPHLPLAMPPHMLDFFEQRAFELVSEAGIREQAVTIQIWFCRNRKSGLRQALGPQTVAVVGGIRSWFRRDEQKLEAWLCRQGYATIFADVDAKTYAEILPISHRRAILHRAVKKPTPKIASHEAN